MGCNKGVLGRSRRKLGTEATRLLSVGGHDSQGVAARDPQWNRMQLVVNKMFLRLTRQSCCPWLLAPNGNTLLQGFVFFFVVFSHIRRPDVAWFAIVRERCLRVLTGRARPTGYFAFDESSVNRDFGRYRRESNRSPTNGIKSILETEKNSRIKLAIRVCAPPLVAMTGRVWFARV